MTECERIIKEGGYNDDFLNEEVRDGYLVSKNMKKVWLIELDLLSQFIKLCNKYNLRYWVGFGTLLGAVRHKGFIPWDDDMDVWMPREDYDNLLKYGNSDLRDPYFLQTTLNDDDYYCSFARLRNSNTTGILVSHRNRCNNGIYMDICPLDGLDKSKLKQKFRSLYIRILNICAHAYLYNINHSFITRIIHYILRMPFIKFKYKHLYVKVNKLAKKVTWEHAKQVGIVAFWPYEYRRNCFRKDAFSKYKIMPFENIMVNIPIGYDHILSTLYGKYMNYPPVDSRGNWHNFTFEPDMDYKTYYKNTHKIVKKETYSD